MHGVHPGRLASLRPDPADYPVAIVAVVCTATPVIVATLVGDIGSGLTASLGAFAAMYGAGRRALGTLAASASAAALLALGVTLGAASAGHPWISIIVVAAFAATVTLYFEVSQFGAPGPQLIVLACAAGTGLPPGNAVGHGLLVLATGVLSSLLVTALAVWRARTARSATPADPPWWPPTPAALLLAARTSAGVLVAGLLATASGLAHPYWAMVAAAGVLGQGSYAAVTDRRALQRVGGAVAGILLAAVVLSFDVPTTLVGIALGMLQGLVVLVVARNYAVAVVVITAYAFLLSDSAEPASGLGALALAWIGQTVIGAVAAVVVARAVWPGLIERIVRSAADDVRQSATLLGAGTTPNQHDMRRVRQRLEYLDRVVERAGGERRGVQLTIARLAPLIAATRAAGVAALHGDQAAQPGADALEAHERNTVSNHTLPAPIEQFISSTNAADPAAFLEAFAPDATLEDWGRVFHGRDGIARWNGTDNIGVQAHFDLVNLRPGSAPGTWIVTLAVSGNGYNGTSPMTFVLDGDRISSLVISG